MQSSKQVSASYQVRTEYTRELKRAVIAVTASRRHCPFDPHLTEANRLRIYWSLSQFTDGEQGLAVT